ncbi:transthyretin [Hymenopellis radicata]|nr:transthyretin [Hymenopellis radicata]
MSKSPITCHILDSSSGRPAPNVEIRLQQFEKATEEDGRCLDLLPPIENSEETKRTITPGLYKIVFKVKDYFENKGQKCFYPWVEITFELEKPTEHYHIPLLISPYSFTTYRGS